MLNRLKQMVNEWCIYILSFVWLGLRYYGVLMQFYCIVRKVRKLIVLFPLLLRLKNTLQDT